MAIYSLHQTTIGRSTHRDGTASAHISYITRKGAGASIGAFGMPANSNEAQAWIYEQEQADRKNARVVDKIMLALPRELTSEQRYKLAESYAKEITQGRAAYYFAIHEQGKDAHNPHCHLVIRDRDIKTGERVIGFSDNARDWKRRGLGAESATHWIRERWEHHANKALSEAGHSVTIDRRTLEAQREEALKQGDLERARELDRKAQIHIGVQANALQEQGLRPESKGKYCKIDNGKTRPEHNAAIIDLNLEKKIRSQDISTRMRGLFEKEQREKEQRLVREHKTIITHQEAAEKDIRRAYRHSLTQLAEERKDFVEQRQEQTRRRHVQQLDTMREQHSQEQEKLEQSQKRFISRVRVFIDFTGKEKEKQKHAIQEALKRQDEQKREQSKEHLKELNAARETALNAYSQKITDTLQAREQALQRLEMQKAEQDKKLQAALQQQAINRHHEKEALETYIKRKEQQPEKTPDPKEQHRQQRQDRAKEIAQQLNAAREAPQQQQTRRREWELEM